jgi:hypothetical protein
MHYPYEIKTQRKPPYRIDAFENLIGLDLPEQARHHKYHCRQQHRRRKWQENGFPEQREANISRQPSHSQLFQPRQRRGKDQERNENSEKPAYHARLSRKIAVAVSMAGIGARIPGSRKLK